MWKFCFGTCAYFVLISGKDFPIVPVVVIHESKNLACSIRIYNSCGLPVEISRTHPPTHARIPALPPTHARNPPSRTRAHPHTRNPPPTHAQPTSHTRTTHLPHTHARALTHAHALTHAPARTHPTHTRTPTTHTRTPTTRVHPPIPCAHTLTLTHTHTHTCSHSQDNTNVWWPISSSTQCAYVHTYTHSVCMYIHAPGFLEKSHCCFCSRIILASERGWFYCPME